MNAKTAPKTSHTLRQWRTAHEQVSRVSADRVAAWAEERDWLYTLLDADDKVIADRERAISSAREPDADDDADDDGEE